MDIFRKSGVNFEHGGFHLSCPTFTHFFNCAQCLCHEKGLTRLNRLLSKRFGSVSYLETTPGTGIVHLGYSTKLLTQSFFQETEHVFLMMLHE